MLSNYFEYKEGFLIWKKRDRKHFNSLRGYSLHLSRYAGKKAGSLDSNGYIQIRLNGKILYAHRVVWEIRNGAIPDGFEIDHIDTNRSNNRIENLRIASSSNNKWNMNKPSHNSSGFKGVSFYKKTGKWAAYIKLNGRKKHLGYFDSPELAHERYKKESSKLFGEFARN